MDVFLAVFPKPCDVLYCNKYCKQSEGDWKLYRGVQMWHAREDPNILAFGGCCMKCSSAQHLASARQPSAFVITDDVITHGCYYTWVLLYMGVTTHGWYYTWVLLLCMSVIIHGCYYTWLLSHMSVSTQGCYYTRVLLHMGVITCGCYYIWVLSHVDVITHGC